MAVFALQEKCANQPSAMVGRFGVERYSRIFWTEAPVLFGSFSVENNVLVRL